MVIRRGDEVFTLDARPSDSIAIALRLQAELYTSDDLLSGTTVQFAENEEGEAEGLLGEMPTEEKTPESGMTPEQLKEHLKKMNPEDLGRFNP
jgi:bifunctional DNase/RNase